MASPAGLREALPWQAGPSADRAAGALWVLLPTAWCAWLLVWLVPVFLVAPHVGMPREWMMRESAPASLLIAAAFFLAAIWPFWPALAREAAPADRIDGRVGPECSPSCCMGARAGFSLRRWTFLSVLELVILLGLAAPFVLVAWSVADRPIDVWPLAAAVGEVAMFSLGLRIAVGGLPGAGRWLMLASSLACVGPVLVAYAMAETLNIRSAALVEASPIAATMHLALDGWPTGTWPIFTQLVLCPAVGLILIVVGWLAARRACGKPCDENPV
jgi:hypothetical protein